MLTFEKIRELERMERDSKKLQKLPDDVIDQLRDYTHRKTQMTSTSADIMEMENVKNTIRRFFEMREQKILSSVLDTVRTGLPPDNMTAHEEHVFYELVDVLKRYREGFFEELRKEPPKHEETHNAPLYRVKKALPEFVGPDMKTYQLKENDVLTLPVELEEFLLKEGVVEKVEQ
jgi:DNA replication initiation complex subunit (GINS family)